MKRIALDSFVITVFGVNEDNSKFICKILIDSENDNWYLRSELEKLVPELRYYHYVDVVANLTGKDITFHI